MVPDKSEPLWRLLVTGQKNYKCQVVPASMMLARVIRATQLDDSTENIDKCVSEIHSFFTRYEPILEQDILAIFGGHIKPIKNNGSDGQANK
ncbi:hypothetical protein [Beggiatoa leptomitoformis]|uniref:Uncharacterized protein n=1 Tax=Beggiatoa leptomitoformis TaxID=288004 RepID=A0A2N9YID2_9GAMM|nr:hypothetical protein [Beggiatoa leptomitoformis]ALG67551.2 hypothetical protein AL038_07350 [Beggiatoa leptomitoformis]AUI70223.1 hypothetical protein BLE401_16965 [Beggiatoa leptomitoformis]